MSADGIGNGGNRDPRDDSFTEMEAVQPEVIEVVPIRHGMVLAGRYAVETILGRGGSGVVVRAHDRDLRVAVAIKILRAELAGQRMWTERLAREVRLARQIQHPNVCRVFDFEQADGRAFVVMELAGKGTLRDELRTGSLAARPVADRIADARAVASALEAIHRAGIIHRDVSPQNLLRMSDGRLVVSDFGLAVDVSEGTSSVHGGTVAYMAPEVLRGGPATFASDIWGLGVVLHEIVFGMKPRWSEDPSPVMLPPKLRRLTPEERAVFETCRACTARDPADRLIREGDVARMLGERPRWWRPRWRLRPAAVRRPAVMATVLTAAAALVVGVVRARHHAAEVPSSAPPRSPLIIPSGEPADWTDASTVLVEVPERITCTRLLPDRQTVRFVWGAPRRAEDVDIVTRKRMSSPLVPAAYAEGCPDLSPDGKRLVFQGHTRDGRAFAFLAENPDGRDAVPTVQTAEPSMLSEPTWLADGQTFSYDIDSKHMGVFSVALGHQRVLPDGAPNPFGAMFRSVVGNSIVISTVSDPIETEFTAIGMPAMQEEMRFRVPGFALDLRSERGLRYYYAVLNEGGVGELVEVDPSDRRARRAGWIRDQYIRYPAFVPNGLTFVSSGLTSSVRVRRSDGTYRDWAADSGILWASRCGRDLVVTRKVTGRIERLDEDGHFIAALSSGPRDDDPGCTADGRVLYYLREKPAAVLRCERGSCKDVMDGTGTMSLSVSPDGGRIALVKFGKRGAVVAVANSDGSRVHELVETETACKAGWASASTLWVSRRRAGAIVWVEIDAETGRDIGRELPGSRDCSDAKPDPASPVQPDVRVVFHQTSQLRLLARDHLQGL